MSDKKLSISASRPQVMTANRLVDGVVVYFTAAGTWSERFEVDGESGEPLSVREIIRAAGPSVRPDLGKQAALR